MEFVLLVARLLLSSVFVVAGVAKLADPRGSRQAVIDFGVPAALAAPLGILLPVAELVVAAALIPSSTAWWGAAGALALLVLFLAGIGVNLARGRKPECHCFGQLHSKPVGWGTFARNAALAAVAGFIVWTGYDGGAGPSAVGWLAGLSTTQALVLIFGLVVVGVMLAQWWVLLHLLRQYGRLLVRVESLEGGGEESEEGLPIGQSAPSFELAGLHGEMLTLESLRAPGKPVMLVFTDPECGPCTALLPDVGHWQEEYSDQLTIAVVSRGEPDENATVASEHGLTNVLLQEDWEVSDAYEIQGTPGAVFVTADGKIGSPVLGGAVEISSFLERTIEEPARLRE